ncbi:carbohydrate ABC transporter permease [Caldanaerobius polysaccharolyticus]|uniref:carbohydrate ABC transporter permease n=1 Tax=Caldanaerobius polysaccharolyticus TaxID=44256 RepID=UPI00047C192B|nr:carbohydrate ABC transporter permease [Caldanaerobius polysaccharolyticus]
MRKKTAYRDIVAYTVLTIGALISLVPFFWMFTTSVKDQSEIFLFPPKWIPSIWHWENYRQAWHAGGLNFTLMFYNTMRIVIPVTISTVVISSLAAYSFARIDFVGKNFIFMGFLASMMVPGTVTIIPQFIMFRTLGWINTLKPLIVPGLFGSAFAIFLLRQFFLTIPQDLEDAAIIDGCSRFRIWWQIFLPLSKPIIATLTVFTFQGVYNDFMGPLIYLNSQDLFTVQLGLAAFRGVYQTRYDLLMAASVFTLVPIIVIFLFAQRYFIEGVVMTGIKG